MLNEKKIRYMTNAASLEGGADKKNLEIAEYFQADYMSIQMLKAVAAYTAAFGISVFLWAGEEAEAILLQLSRPDYAGNLLKVMLIFYVAGLVLYEIVTYFYFLSKYKRAKEYAGKYYRQLKKIYEFYESQEAADGSDAAAGKKTDEERTL